MIYFVLPWKARHTLDVVLLSLTAVLLGSASAVKANIVDIGVQEISVRSSIVLRDAVTEVPVIVTVRNFGQQSIPVARMSLRQTIPGIPGNAALLDSDGDGWKDIIEETFGSDPQRPGSTPETSKVPASCADGLDNDLDGFSDDSDPSCLAQGGSLRVLADPGGSTTVVLPANYIKTFLQDGAVLVQPEMESGRSRLVSIPPCGRGFSRHRGLSVRCLFFKGARAVSLRSDHRLDEPTGLSLSMVASPQYPLPFRPARSL